MELASGLIFIKHFLPILTNQIVMSIIIEPDYVINIPQLALISAMHAVQRLVMKALYDMTFHFVDIWYNRTLSSWQIVEQMFII